MAALGRKCEQYIKLQMDMQKQNEKVMDLERKLQLQGATAAPASSAETTKLQNQLLELQKRVEASEALCKKLFESGLYWQKRGQRKDRELKELKRQLAERYSFEWRSGGSGPPSSANLDNSRPSSGTLTRATSLPPVGTHNFLEDPNGSLRMPTVRIEESGDEASSPRRPPSSINLDRAQSLGRSGRASSIAAKVVAPHIIHGGGKGSISRASTLDSTKRPATNFVPPQDSMDQFF